jgi:hypothetical protein
MNIASNAFVSPSSVNALAMLKGMKQPAPIETRPQAKPAFIDTPSMREPAGNVARPSTQRSPEPATPANPLTLKELQAAWGTNNKRCDLDGNGTVDMDDMVMFIASLNTSASPLEAESIANDVTEPATDLSTATPSAPLEANTTKNPPLTIEGFHKAWGQDGSNYDINNDGTVNMDDLVQFITSQPAPATPETPVSESATDNAASPTDSPTPAPRSTPVDQSPESWNKAKSHSPSAATTNSRKTGELVAALTNRLDRLGFANQPPINIRELIDAMDFSPSQSNEAIRQLQQRYPKGLGVNLVG